MKAQGNAIFLSYFDAQAREYDKKDGSKGRAPAARKAKFSLLSDDGRTTEELFEIPTEGEYARPELAQQVASLQCGQKVTAVCELRKFGNSPWRVELVGLGKAA